MNVSLVGITPSSLESSNSHSHNVWEIVLNIEGEGTTIIGNCSYPFYPGVIICNPPNVAHSKFSPGKFRDIFIHVDNLVLPAGKEVYIVTDDEEKTFEKLMFLALLTFHKKEANSSIIVNSLCTVLYQMLISRTQTCSKNDSVELFKNKLIQNFTNPEYQIADAMKTTPYCNDYFRRCFKKETGITPIAYLTNLRIAYAKKLLQQEGHPQMKISQISLLAGFYDAHYFSRIFKKNLGRTPQEYAREQKKDDRS